MKNFKVLTKLRTIGKIVEMLTKAMKWASSTPSIIFVLFILKNKLFVNAQHHFMMFEGEVLNGYDLKPIPNVLVVVTQVQILHFCLLMKLKRLNIL